MQSENEKRLKDKYESIAKTLDYNTTASDYQLRELEIDTASKYIRDGDKLLDIGCGLGYAVTQYVERFNIHATGLDYAENMIEGANKLLEKNAPTIKESIDFIHGSVLELPFEDSSFDIITSSRCLMALLDWEKQKQALKELNRVLKSGGVLVLMEGTFDGLNNLNEARIEFGLEAIEADGKTRLNTLKFHERELLDFTRSFFMHENTHRFGMYYFLTRIVQPLLVAPDPPSYEHKINKVAKELARVYPNFNNLGHLVAFILIKRR